MVVMYIKAFEYDYTDHNHHSRKLEMNPRGSLIQLCEQRTVLMYLRLLYRKFLNEIGRST
jgi:hypothetical protein